MCLRRPIKKQVKEREVISLLSKHYPSHNPCYSLVRDIKHFAFQGGIF